MLNAKATKRAKKTNKQKNRSNKTTFASAASKFFLHFFAVVVARLYNVKLSSFSFYGGKCMFSQKILSPVFGCSPSFSLPLIFTLLIANISTFFTIALKFSCCVSNKIRQLHCFFISRSSPI